MTPAQFKAKWTKFSGKESAAYQEHFNDLCRMLQLPTPVEADPTGSDTFCFQKYVAKDAEFFDIGAAGTSLTTNKERGFADVWKRDCFGWEYKGEGEDLDKAYKQLLRYRESLLNPPLLIVCDFDRFIIRTNFNGAVQETHAFTNDEIDSPHALHLLRAALTDPESLRPRETTAHVTEKLARQIADIARILQEREAVELADAKTRKQHYVAQKKNLRIARFLNRLVFCFFAEDTGLLPANIFSDVCKIGIEEPQRFAETLEDLFRCMAKGGRFGAHRIRHFNGHLFHDATVFELTPDEIRALADAAAADWQHIQPSIMGNLFERGLDPGQRSQLGAHYTSEADIKTLVEPVLMAPLRREWTEVKRAIASLIAKSKSTNDAREKLAAFQKKLVSVIVLDPACGSGNFLYVALQLLLALEKEVITAAAQLDSIFKPQVSVQQLRAIEINAYAYELAQVSVQIGYLQWRRDNGFDNDRTPVLQNLDGFENKDALLNETFRKKPKNLKVAQAEEHGGQDNLFKVYTERAWPPCNVIVGNPPFLGGKLLRREFLAAYVDGLFEVFENRVPSEADLCCYWFEKARQQIEDGNCQRAGLLATQGIRGGANREVLKRIKKTGDIFFAISDRAWILAGANVHVSMVGFDDDTETFCEIDGKPANEIYANLTSSVDITSALELRNNLKVAFMGTTKGGSFEIEESDALQILDAPNPHGRPNSDVVTPWVNGKDLTQRPSRTWIIDFGVGLEEQKAAQYESPFEYARKEIKPKRQKNNRESYRRLWWQHVEARPAMREKLAPLKRFLCTARVSKHRLFVWLSAPTLPDSATFAFARADDYFLGILHSRFHEIWARAQGTQLREKESGFRYTPTTCFETFPFPFRDDMQPPLDNLEAEMNAAKFYAHIVLHEEPPPLMPSARRIAISEAAKELNALRERWLNPPEWTETRTLEFPGSRDGAWERYIARETIDPLTAIGTVRYPRLEPRDADCAAKLKTRTLTKLYNERPAWLANAHAKLDSAVAAAYGFPADLSEEQILERLLALNLERTAEEAAAEKSANRHLKKRASRTKHADEML